MATMADSKARRTRRSFTYDYKAGAVRLVLDEGKTVAAAARDLGLTESSLRNWVEQARADRTKGKTGLTTEERPELAALRKDNRELRMERDILSLATLPALFHELNDAGFAALVLFDPPSCPPGGSPADMEALLQPPVARPRRRQRFFETREEFTEAISRSQVFARIPRKTLELFAQMTLRPAANGGYELCCPPEHEAQIFEFYFGWAMQATDVLQHVGCPVIVIGSDPTSSHSYMPSLDLRILNTLRYDFIPDTTHFLQLENPETCTALTLDFLEEQGVA